MFGRVEEVVVDEVRQGEEVFLETFNRTCGELGQMDFVVVVYPAVSEQVASRDLAMTLVEVTDFQIIGFIVTHPLRQGAFRHMHLVTPLYDMKRFFVRVPLTHQRQGRQYGRWIGALFARMQYGKSTMAGTAEILLPYPRFQFADPGPYDFF